MRYAKWQLVEILTSRNGPSSNSLKKAVGPLQTHCSLSGPGTRFSNINYQGDAINPVKSLVLYLENACIGSRISWYFTWKTTRRIQSNSDPFKIWGISKIWRGWNTEYTEKNPELRTQIHPWQLDEVSVRYCHWIIWILNGLTSSLTEITIKLMEMVHTKSGKNLSSIMLRTSFQSRFQHSGTVLSQLPQNRDAYKRFPTVIFKV